MKQPFLLIARVWDRIYMPLRATGGVAYDGERDVYRFDFDEGYLIELSSSMAQIIASAWAENQRGVDIDRLFPEGSLSKSPRGRRKQRIVKGK